MVNDGAKMGFTVLDAPKLDRKLKITLWKSTYTNADLQRCRLERGRYWLEEDTGLRVIT
jgi:hypothetical protein